MQYQARLDEAESRYNELTAQMADPAVINDAEALPQDRQGAIGTGRAGRQIPRVEEGIAGTGEARVDAGGNRSRPARDGANSKSSAWSRSLSESSRRSRSAAAQRSERREKRHTRNSQRRRRRRGIAVCRRSVPHVHALCRRTGLESGGHFAERIVRRRLERSDRADQRHARSTAG